MKSLLIAFSLFLCLLSVPDLSRAQWSVDPAVNNVVARGRLVQRNVRTISDGKGGAFFAWEDFHDTLAAHIFAQRLNGAGKRLWVFKGDTNGIRISSTKYQQVSASIVPDGFGGAIILWAEQNETPYQLDLYAQRLDSNGTVLWKKGGVLVAANCEEMDGSAAGVIPDGTGGAICSFVGKYIIASNIYVQRISAAGVRLLATAGDSTGVIISTGGSYTLNRPSMVTDNSGGAIVAWEEFPDAANSLIRAQRIDVNGAGAWTSGGVALTNASGLHPIYGMVPDGYGGACVGFLQRDVAQVPSNQIYCQHVEGSGRVPWTLAGKELYSGDNLIWSPSMTHDSISAVVVSWIDTRSSFGKAGVYAQRVGIFSGSIGWTANGVRLSSSANSNMLHPAIVADGTGGVFGFWEDTRGGGYIYGQHLNINGTPIWNAPGDTNGVRVGSVSDGNIIAATSDGLHGAITCWEDLRNVSSGRDLYAQRVGYTGIVTAAAVPSLGAQMVNSHRIDLRFEKADASETAFFIERNQEYWDGNWSGFGFLASVPATTTTYSDSGVADGLSCTYRIYAAVPKGVTGYTAEKTATTLLDPLRNLSASIAGGNIVLNYSFNHDASDSTIIERKTGTAGSFIQVGKIGRSNTYYDLTPVLGTTYTYRVRESGRHGTSVPSNEASIVFRYNTGTVLPGWSTSDMQNNVVSDYPSEKQIPASCSDGNGGAFIVWEDFRGGSNAQHLYAQHIGAQGALLWKSDGVRLVPGAAGQSQASVVADGAGGMFVSWLDFRSPVGLYIQHFDASARPTWSSDSGAVILDTTVYVYFSVPNMIPDGSGGVYVGWQNGYYGYAAYIQHFDKNGKELFTKGGQHLPVESYYVSNPMVTTDRLGKLCVVWSAYDFGAGRYWTYFQKYDANGIPQFGDNPVNVASSKNTVVGLIADGLDGAIVVWREGDQRTAVYTQRIDSRGSGQWQYPGIVVNDSSQYADNVQIMSDGMGGAVLSWYSRPNVGGTSQARAQRIDGGGAVQWAPGGVSLSQYHGYQDEIFITSVDQSGATIAFRTKQSSEEMSNVNLQKVSMDGSALWGNNGVPVSVVPGRKYLGAALSGANGGSIVVWNDGREVADNIYAQYVDAQGYLGSAAPSIAFVHDVPADQGGEVTLAWNPSYLDSRPASKIASYTLFRGVTGGTTGATAAVPMSLFHKLAPAAKKAARYVSVPRTSTGVSDNIYWENMGDVDAHQLHAYSSTIATLADSGSAGNAKNYFMVMASTADPNVWWLSNPDSGWSVDNVAPSAPGRLSGGIGYGIAGLYWDRVKDADFHNYEVYRDSVNDFETASLKPIAVLADTFFVDNTVKSGKNYYYIVRAVDAHGNRSVSSNLLRFLVAGVGDGDVPRVFQLNQNYPNPFNPTTTISFTVEKTQHTSVVVYNILGAEVARLFDGEAEPGKMYNLAVNAADWATGVYTYRIVTTDHVAVKRMMLLK